MASERFEFIRRTNLARCAHKFWSQLLDGPQVTLVNPQTQLRAFFPSSGGSNRKRNKLAIKTAANFLPVFARVLDSFSSLPEIEDLDRFVGPAPDQEVVDKLSQMLNIQGSDKARLGYHRVYGQLFENLTTVQMVVEIGIGTANQKFVSNMGRGHSGVGGSLRAWKEFFPTAEIHGFDIDESSFFREPRIETSFMDQTSDSSIALGLEQFPDESIDLFIDDGLHSLDANLLPLVPAFKKVKLGGWLVVEDIAEEAVPAWQILARQVPIEKAKCSIIRCNRTYLFLLQRR